MSVGLPIGRPACLLVGLVVLALALAVAPGASAAPGEAPASTAKIAAAAAPEKETCQEGGLLSKLTHPTQVLSVECMTKKAVRTVFGLNKGSLVMKPFLETLIEIPDFVETGNEGVGDAEWLSEAIAFALLGAVITFAVLHFWAAGFTSGGGGMVLDGVVRCTGAALFILAWPFLFTNAGNLTDALTRIIIPGRAVDASLAAILAAGTLLGSLDGGWWGALFVAIGLLVAFLVLFVALALIKIGLLAGLMVAFVGMPIAVALWPIPSLSAPASYGVRFVGMVFSTVIIWALCFKVFGSVNAQFVAWGGKMGVLDKLMLPVVGIAELGALLAVPRHATAMWNIASGRGTVGSIASHAASNVISSRISRGGGFGAAMSAAGSRSRLGRMTGAVGGRAAAGGASGGPGGGGPGGGASGGGTPGSGGSGGGGRHGGATGPGNGSGSAAASAAGSTTAGGNGAPSPRSATRRSTLAADGMPKLPPGVAGEAKARQIRERSAQRRMTNPPSREAARVAAATLKASGSGRYGPSLQRLMGPGHDDSAVTERLSHFAAAPGVSGAAGNALETLMAAEPAVRSEAFGLGSAEDRSSPAQSLSVGPPQVAVSQANQED